MLCKRAGQSYKGLYVNGGATEMPYFRGYFFTDEEYAELGLRHEYDYDARFSEVELKLLREKMLEQFQYYSGVEVPSEFERYNSRGSAAFLGLCLLDHDLLRRAKQQQHWSPDLVAAYRTAGAHPEHVLHLTATDIEFNKFKIKLANHLRDGLTNRFIWRNPETVNIYWDDFTVFQILNQANSEVLGVLQNEETK